MHGCIRMLFLLGPTEGHIDIVFVLEVGVGLAGLP